LERHASQDEAAERLLGISGRTLADRFDAGLDRVEREFRSATVYRYQDSGVLYQVAEVASGNGQRLNWVFRDSDPAWAQYA
jgi:hypothetical protein